MSDCSEKPCLATKIRHIYHTISSYPRGHTGLTHEITIVRGRQGANAEDRSIRTLGVEIPSVYLLPMRDEYTCVYTTVYPRVHNSIHACTLPRSKYILCRARLYVYSLGIMPRIFSDGLRLLGIGNNTPKDPKAGVRARSCVGPRMWHPDGTDIRLALFREIINFVPR